MGLSPDVSFDIASAVICGVLIACRCLYRLLFTCKLHPTCHRRWRVDDAYMALALIPLIVRTVTIVTSFILNPDHAGSPPTAEEAAASGLSVSQLASHWVVSRKLLIPSRLSYALLCVNTISLPVTPFAIPIDRSRNGGTPGEVFAEAF
jgi:hypothetical protein